MRNSFDKLNVADREHLDSLTEQIKELEKYGYLRCEGDLSPGVQSFLQAQGYKVDVEEDNKGTMSYVFW